MPYRVSLLLLFALACGDDDDIRPDASSDVSTADISATDAGNEDAAIDAAADGGADTSPDDSGSDAGVPESPNFVILIADDMGVDSLSAYPYTTDVPNTPTLARLAAEGMTFDDAWATPACTTTRGTIITGDHGVNTGVSFVPAVLSTDTMTILQALKQRGEMAPYANAVFGKWHLGGGRPSPDHPVMLGVDTYAGNIAGNISDYFTWEITEDGERRESTEYHTTKITDLAIEWARGRTTPWLLWMAYYAPHTPHHLPPAELHERDDLTGRADDIRMRRREYYFAAIEAMDAEIDRLLQALPDPDNTYVIFLGDNGTSGNVLDPSVFDRGRGKLTIYEGGVRVPFIVRGPGIPADTRSNALVNTTDIYATLLELSSTPGTAPENSHSFRAALSGGDGERTHNYTEYQGGDATGWTVRNRTHKLMVFTDGTEALYRLDGVVNEGENLIDTETEIADALRAVGLALRGE